MYKTASQGLQEALYVKIKRKKVCVHMCNNVFESLFNTNVLVISIYKSLPVKSIQIWRIVWGSIGKKVFFQDLFANSPVGSDASLCCCGFQAGFVDQ